ncbi:MAG: hypothetical protein A2081_04210 [Elusimicrobia bacterium GWC2_61_19]|nr:MAG: hypothetical protein A2081_04210 [Elusimicrobia bacterium GWC2_61_19]
MKKTGMTDQDPAAPGKTLQALLLTAFSLTNLEPFLRRLLGTLSGPGGFGSGCGLAIIVGCPDSAPTAAFSNIPAAERRLMLASPRVCPVRTKKGSVFCAPVMHGGARTGYIFARAGKTGIAGESARRLTETTAMIIAARLAGEKRDAELNLEKDIASAVKHVEELYLAFPNISIEEISRAVMDEARRMTGSDFGFAGHIDPATGWFMTSSLTTETCAKCRMAEKPVVFKDFTGLWGWVLKRKKPLLTNGADKDRRAIGIPHGHVKIDKFLGVPAMSGRKLLGMLALANPAGDYRPEDLETAQKLARVYAMILQRKLGEDKQREEDARFKAIISSSKDIIYTADLTGRITYMSPRVEDYGFAPGEMVGYNVLEFSHPDDKDFLTKALANAARTGRTLPILPFRAKRKDGTYFYAEQKSGLVFNGEKPAYITCVVRDVTEQRETELRLKESETLMRMVFDTAKDAIFIKDMNGMYVKANKACAELLGTTTEKIIGSSDTDYLPKTAAAEIFRTDSEVVRTGRTLSLINHHAFPTGSRHVNIIKTPLKNVQGKTIGLLGIARDITDLKRMEAELAIARAADAVSEVARPMAHDFNNALAAINGYATLIDDGLTDTSPIKTEISQIIKAVQRAAELTSKFQDFARNPKIGGQGGGNA